MADLVVLEPTKLVVMGLALHNGQQVRLGQVTLVSPEKREEQVADLLELIHAAAKEGELCNMGSLSFDPSAFDVFMVV